MAEAYSEGGNRRRAAPTAFAEPAVHTYSSPPAPPATPPPEIRHVLSETGNVESRQNGSLNYGAPSDMSLTPIDSMWSSSNHVASNGSAQERIDDEHRAMNGTINMGNDSLRGVLSPSIPMGPPPSTFGSLSKSVEPANFAKGLRIPPTVNPSPGRGSSFSEIPLAPGTPPEQLQQPGRENGKNGNAYGTLYSDTTRDDQSTNFQSASSNFVLFSAQTVLQNKKLANISSLGFGALVSPGNEPTPAPPVVRRNGLRCTTCGAYCNLFCGVVPVTGHWRCALCGKLSSSDGEYRSASPQNIGDWPELVTSVIDYVDTDPRHPGLVSVSDSTMAAPVIILIDETLDEAHLQLLQGSLHSFFNSVPPSTRIGIISFGKIVSVYDLSESGFATADTLPGDCSPSQELLTFFIYGTGVYIAPVHACLSIAQTIVASLRPYRGELPERVRDRCFGTAVQVALALIQGPSTELPRSTVRRSGGSNRIVVCMGGPNTLGIGSVPQSESHPNYEYLEKKGVKQMEHLGLEARRLDTSVDILCGGTCPVKIPILQPLARTSGGALVIHDDFGESFGANLQRAVQRVTGFRGTMEIRTSREIAVTRVIGPGEEASLDSSDFRKDTATAVQMLCVEDGQGFALSMETVKNITADFVYFQFVTRFTSIHQSNVIRVITARLPTTNSPATYLQSVDDEVAAVLIAKNAVLRAKNVSDLPGARSSVDERMKDIAKKFGSEMPKTRVWCFPKEISRLPELLFHLKRGPLLGRIVGHEDERAVYRNLFLQASFDLALRMLAPRLFMHKGGGAFDELPAHDLAMQSDASLVLDHGTDIFIWTGMAVSADEGERAFSLAACRALAAELIEHRFPAPRILSFKEASSQARYLQSRLIPAHKDPAYEQEARFPQLRSLRPDQRTRLKSSFFQTDDLSFIEWMRSMNMVPTEPL